MKQQHHFGRPNDAACKEAARVRALINDLGGRVRILESDIAREEELAGASDPSNTAYPIVARTLAAHRDNLKQTIAALEKRLPAELAPTA